MYINTFSILSFFHIFIFQDPKKSVLSRLLFGNCFKIII
jgi:hypothetical protein